MAQQLSMRGLAKAYANGQIDKNKYRTERKAYLESVLSGEISLPIKEPDTEPAKFSSTYGRTLQKEELAAATLRYKEKFSKEEDYQSPSGSKMGLVLGMFVLSIVIIFAFVMLSGGDGDAVQSQNQQANNQATSNNAQPSEAQNLLARFLEENNWAPSNLDAFLTNWRGIAESERTLAMRSTEFSRLINAIYKKLLEERALSKIGNPQTSYENQRQLVEFASSIGINDQRISLPERPDTNNLYSDDIDLEVLEDIEEAYDIQ